MEEKKRKKKKKKKEKRKSLVDIEIDSYEDVIHLRGTKKLKKIFSPLLLLFDVEPSGNIFKDFGSLAQKLKDEQFFLDKIFSKIFEQYDTNSDGKIDHNELKELLKDVGRAIDDPKLEFITKERLEKIVFVIDENQNNLIEKEELVKYLIQWVECEEDEYQQVDGILPPIPPFKRQTTTKDDDYYDDETSFYTDDEMTNYDADTFADISEGFSIADDLTEREQEQAKREFEHSEESSDSGGAGEEGGGETSSEDDS